MHIDDLIEKAKVNSGIRSDNQLAKAIGIAHTSLMRVRKGWGHLSDDNMIKLGKLAGVDETESLLLLNVWRSTGAAKEAYTGMLKRFAFISLSLTILCVFSAPSNASPLPQKCYMSNKMMYIMAIIIDIAKKLWLKAKYALSNRHITCHGY